MKMSEDGFSEDTEQVLGMLVERERNARGAWQAAAHAVMEDFLDAVKPGIPRVSGRLAGSGFVNREGDAVGGFGMPYALEVHRSPGRGYEFQGRVFAVWEASIPERMAAYFDRFIEEGVDISNMPVRYPEIVTTPTRALIAHVRGRFGAKPRRPRRRKR